MSEPKECRELVGGVLQVGVIVIVMMVVVVLVLGEGRKPQQPHKTQKHKTQDTRERETTKEESVFLRVRGIFRGSTCYLANYLRTLWLWL